MNCKIRIAGLMACMLISLLIVNTPVYAEETQEFQTEECQTEEFQAFVDDYFATNMEKYNVKGAEIAIVKDGRELLCSSYGVSDLETGTLVQEDTTFPACSVSKMFTATAVMQLVEQGKIDLDEDIRKYLPDIEIKNSYEREVTCRELLTHSSGLDEQSELAGSTLDIGNIKSQSFYFQNHIPIVIREPGSVSCYSNMGYNILGYIIEEVSGENYEEYIAKHILEPLQMKNTTVRKETVKMASGYYYENGNYVKQKFAYQYTSGSSGIISTAKDMEKFMLFHLQDKKFCNAGVLEQSTLEQMKMKQFSNHEEFDGMGFGWIRTHYGNIDVVKHEGALPGYATTMFLIPQAHIGVYVSTNNTTGICFDFENAFMEKLYGKEALEGAVQDNITLEDGDKENLSVYTGIYRNYDGISKRNLMKLGILFDDATDMRITRQGKDMLRLVYYDQEKNRIETDLKYCKKDVFLRTDGKGYICFSPKGDEKDAYYAFTQVSHCSYEKVHFYEKKGLLLMGAVSFFLLVIFSINIVRKIIRKRPLFLYTRRSGIVISVTQMILVLSTMVSVFLTGFMISNYNYDMLTVLQNSIFVQSMGSILMILGVMYGLYRLFRAKMKCKQRIVSIVIVLMQLSAVFELYYFNFIRVHVI